MKKKLWFIFIMINAGLSFIYFAMFHHEPTRIKIIHHASVSERPLEEIDHHTSYISEAEGKLPWWQSFLCNFTKHFTADDVGSVHPLQQLFRNITPSRENANVFLVDTSCNSSPRFRAWCSVESWAQQNPNLDVWLVMTSTSIKDVDDFPTRLLKHYPNLNIVGGEIEKMFEGTPLLQLFESRRWTQNDTWPVELMSDMMRVLVLWHWGGIYSDTDVISIKPFNFPSNSLGYETTFQIGSAVYSFKAHHQVLWRLMEDMTNGFKPTLWGSIGPKAITRVVKKLCDVDDLEPLFPTAPVACGEVTLLPKSTFYPIDYTQSRKFFSKRRGRKFETIFEHSSAIHFWNKLSNQHIMRKGDLSLFEVAARRFCPVTYRRAMKDSNTL